MWIVYTSRYIDPFMEIATSIPSTFHFRYVNKFGPDADSVLLTCLTGGVGSPPLLRHTLHTPTPAAEAFPLSSRKMRSLLLSLAITCLASLAALGAEGKPTRRGLQGFVTGARGPPVSASVVGGSRSSSSGRKSRFWGVGPRAWDNWRFGYQAVTRGSAGSRIVVGVLQGQEGKVCPHVTRKCVWLSLCVSCVRQSYPSNCRPKHGLLSLNHIANSYLADPYV